MTRVAGADFDGGTDDGGGKAGTGCEGAGDVPEVTGAGCDGGAEDVCEGIKIEFVVAPWLSGL